MARLIKRTNNNYTNVSNVLARDKRLSWKARGIFLYMWSQADNWQFYVKELVSHAIDGEGSLTSGLKELEKYGYLKRAHRQTKNGVFDGMDWILSDQPSSEQGEKTTDGKTKGKTPKNPKNPSDGKSTGWENHQMDKGSLRNNNSKNYQNKELSNTSKQNASASDALSVPQLEAEFEVLWSKYPNKKGKKEAFNHYKAWRKKSKGNTNDHLLKRLNVYKKYIEANSNWYHPMNGSTWFNGRFDDDWSTDNSSAKPAFDENSFFNDNSDPFKGTDVGDLPF